MQIKPFTRRVERNVRPVESKGYEEGPGVLSAQQVDDPAGILVVVALIAPIVLRAEIPEPLKLRLDPLRPLVHLTRGGPDVVEGPLLGS